MLVTVGSLRGAPGATTVALALAARWRSVTGRPALVVEADPDGGCMVARLGVATRPGLTELAGTSRSGLDDPSGVWAFAQRARVPTATGEVPVVVGPASAESAQAALRAAAEPLAVGLGGITDHDVIIDVGRLRPGSPALPLAAGADERIVVSAATLEAVVALKARRDLLHGLGSWQVVVTGPEEYASCEIARVLDVRVTQVPIHGRRTDRAIGALAASLGTSRAVEQAEVGW